MTRATVLTALLLTATAAFATLTGDERTDLLDMAAELQRNADDTVHGTDPTGADRIAAIDFGRGPVVYVAGTPVSSADDVLFCAEQPDGQLDDCETWLADSTGCYNGICWCSGACEGYVATVCPEPWYDSSCTPKEGGGQLCVCTDA